MLTCTWAPTVFAGPRVVSTNAKGGFPGGAAGKATIQAALARIEALGLSHLLIAQRWWGSGAETEGSSLDCLAMTAFCAAHTERIRLVTAIHPGFFHPTAIAKWGATMDWLSEGRWDINVTSGWNMREFDMYGVDQLDHGARYARSAEFIEVLRGAWGAGIAEAPFSYQGRFYRADGLRLEPRPSAPLTVFQGGQSSDAVAMAAKHSDWMFLNGGSLERVGRIIENVRAACRGTGRTVRFALYAAPLVRRTDADAWAEIDARIAAIDRGLAERRRAATSSGAPARSGGAEPGDAGSAEEGAADRESPETPESHESNESNDERMWSSTDDLSLLDTNEGYAPRLIGSPETVYDRLQAFRDLGIEMLHFDTRDALFNETVLPELTRPSSG